MSNVNLTIGGRTFAVACAAGEEQHVAKLGRMIDEKVSTMGEAGTQNEARMLLFGALLLADELSEARSRRDDSGPFPAPSVDSVSSEVLHAIAGQLENLADQLESSGSSA